MMIYLVGLIIGIIVVLIFEHTNSLTAACAFIAILTSIIKVLYKTR